MDLPNFPSKVQKLWDIWDLRVLIFLSLLLQAILILVASTRKRTGSKVVIVVIWAAYLLADWVANVAVGQASTSQLLVLDRNTGTSITDESGKDLVAFWAPFLLLHLGGPDSITSFSLEDNELWLRHLLGLVLQFLAVVYVFLQTLPTNKLWLPTSLILIAGTIKYGERTNALYNASLGRLGVSVLPKPQPGSEYEKISRRLDSIEKSNLPTRWKIVHNPERKFWDSIIDESGKPDDRSLLEAGYEIFKIFKGLIVGQIFSSKERETSRNFFLKRNAREAFRLVEFELSFMYEILHTKLAAAQSRSRCALRLFCFSAEVASFFIFLLIDKKRFKKFDQVLTFLLLVGAVVLEIISLVMLLFSDWTAVSLKNKVGEFVTRLVLEKRRWSESVSQCNFINYCLARRWFDELAESLGIDDLTKMIVMRRTAPSQPVSKENLKEFIFKELKKKSEKAKDVETAENLCSRGRAAALLKDPAAANHPELAWSIDEFQFAESLLLWHIATDLCCYEEDNSIENRDVCLAIAMDLCCYQDTSCSDKEDSSIENRDVCKLLSNYMLYLLEIKPEMMAPVAGNWQLVFQDTCAEAKRFFRKSSLSTAPDACCQLLSVETRYRSAMVKGGNSKSVLFDACKLAKQLRHLEPQSERWTVMSQVWVEFMCYAAINCRPTVHAQQPSTGGELVTFVWLLNTHLGLGKQFYDQVSVGKVKILQRK